MEITELRLVKGLMVMANQDDLATAAAALLERARAIELLPYVMDFEQCDDYVESGQYMVTLFGS